MLLMVHSTIKLGSNTRQQTKPVFLQEPRHYPAIIQLIVVEPQLDEKAALYRDYDPLYADSTERMSPLWRIS
jgi:hypothetical protein